MAFLVDVKTPILLIKKIMTENYTIWGGSYNPIVPVEHGVIQVEWVRLLEQIDPDIVYHSESVNPDELRKAGLRVYPRSYEIIPENGMLNLPGVNPLAFIDTFFRHELTERRHVSVPYFLHGFDHMLREFLALNFGVRPLFIEDDMYLQEVRKVAIYDGNVETALSLMWSQIGFRVNLLCESYLGNEVFRAETYRATEFELIVYDEDNSFQDLLYFWNRKLFQKPSKKQLQFAVSIAELEAVISDNFFHEALSRNAGEGKVQICSNSITREEISVILKKAAPKNLHVEFEIIDAAVFPYPHKQTDLAYKPRWIKTLLKGHEDYIALVDYPLSDPIRLDGEYELDSRINNSGDAALNEFLFPYHTVLKRIVTEIPARVNRYNALSFHVDSQTRGIDIRIPVISDIIKSRIQARCVAGKLEYTKGLVQTNVSGAGLLLSAFMKLFNDDWSLVSNYALDKFWLEVFTGISRYQKIKQTWQLGDASSVDKSNISSKLEQGNGLFSYKDLQHQLKCIYNLFHIEIADKGKDKESRYIVSDMNAFISERYKEDNKSILEAMDFFVASEVIFIGLKVKCHNCGSNLWYPLKELSNSMTCRGCSFGIKPIAESPFYYKVNDTILNNLMSDPVKRTKSYGGNYIVLEVLNRLRDHHPDFPVTAFGFSPSLDIYLNHDDFKKTDLDIVALQNGRLIVGEAKMNASEFDAKQIKQLIWIANQIQPEVILLAYKDGKLIEEILEEVRNGIVHPHIDVQAMTVGDSWFHFGAMFGLSKLLPKDEPNKELRLTDPNV